MKNLILSKYNQLALLFTLSIMGGTLLMFRIKITASFYLLFLVWNIFLATIPYAITFLIQLKRPWFTNKGVQTITFLVWLLFLPNAPYIVSDFTHLQGSDPSILPIDAIIIGLSSLLGLLYMSLSIQDMKKMFFVTLSQKQNLLFTTGACILIGFGIYLGRYLRWNSWDIIQNPMQLALDVKNIISNPIQHKFAWGITLSYASMSWIATNITNKLKWAQ